MCASPTTSIVIGVLEMQILGLHIRPTRLGNLEVGPGKLIQQALSVTVVHAELCE